MNIVVNPKVLFAEIPAHLVSGSQAELGPHAAEITWRNARKLVIIALGGAIVEGTITPPALREYFASYGAWDEVDVANWKTGDLCALMIQEIAADYRAQVEHGARQDQVRHNLAADGLLYCYFGV